MKFYNLVIKYRLPLAIALLALGILVNVTSGFWPGFPLYFVAVILLFGYFFFGPVPATAMALSAMSFRHQAPGQRMHFTAV